MRQFKSVHDAHCCPNCGCKYGDHRCPVEIGTEEGILCEDCERDEEEYVVVRNNVIEQIASQFDDSPNAEMYREDVAKLIRGMKK